MVIKVRENLELRVREATPENAEESYSAVDRNRDYLRFRKQKKPRDSREAGLCSGGDFSGRHTFARPVSRPGDLRRCEKKMGQIIKIKNI